ncbi:hypothetical protein [Pasteurella atlantica]|uniref:hypothetical protein n=1 Tax=Pasteurellaceae TaxID=712 RepID=UPI002776CC2A|nr:hypothetical protein [Pasteurella atlantica]MDP8098395.1 hypothetical protein [Pasteurella atlantica]MDP8106491.1 hypothetical protein [Pasteurella atlantica]MDP8116198.1 hypothetical protein [Pasteurella atlantica]
MLNESKVTGWLKDNTDLSWTLTNGDTPSVKLDRLYINRSEGYEIRDFILKFYDKYHIKHKSDNYKITFEKIMAYKEGEKVKTEDLLNHLKEIFNLAE